MQHTATRIIRDEHAALAAMLRSIRLLLDLQHRSDAPPDFDALRAMLFYLDEFPDQRHHRKETQLLFPKLRAKAPLARHLLDHLDAEHATGHRHIRELEHALIAWEVMGESRRDAFEREAAHYADFYLAHMRVEEEKILPLAEEMLTEADWAELDDAFMQNRDPMTGQAPEKAYEALFSRIAHCVPAPVGLGRVR